MRKLRCRLDCRGGRSVQDDKVPARLREGGDVAPDGDGAAFAALGGGLVIGVEDGPGQLASLFQPVPMSHATRVSPRVLTATAGCFASAAGDLAGGGHQGGREDGGEDLAPSVSHAARMPLAVGSRAALLIGH